MFMPVFLPPRHPDIAAQERGIRCLLGKQLPNGDWPQVRGGRAVVPTVTPSLPVSFHTLPKPCSSEGALGT